MIAAMKNLLQISAKDWLFAFVSAVVAAFVLHLVAELVGALFALVAVLSLLFAAAALIKSVFFGTPEETGGGGAE